MDGIQAMRTAIQDYGELTTPQLHYMVRSLNTAASKNPYGEPTESGYYSKLSAAFCKLVVLKLTVIMLFSKENRV